MAVRRCAHRRQLGKRSLERNRTTLGILEMEFDGNDSVGLQKIHSRANDAMIISSQEGTRSQRFSRRNTLRHVIAEHFNTIDIRDNSRGIENTKVVGSHVGEGTHFLAEVLSSSDGLGPVSTKVAIPVGHSSRDVLPVGNERRRKLPLAIWSDGGVQRKRDGLLNSCFKSSLENSSSPLILNIDVRTLVPTILTSIAKNESVLIILRLPNASLSSVHTVVEQIANSERADAIVANQHFLLTSVSLRNGHHLQIVLVFIAIKCKRNE